MTRSYLNSKHHNFMRLLKKDKEIQDELTQCQDVQTGQKKFQRYFEQKRRVLNESVTAVLKQAYPGGIHFTIFANLLRLSFSF